MVQLYAVHYLLLIVFMPVWFCCSGINRINILASTRGYCFRFVCLSLSAHVSWRTMSMQSTFSLKMRLIIHNFADFVDYFKTSLLRCVKIDSTDFLDRNWFYQPASAGKRMTSQWGFWTMYF